MTMMLMSDDHDKDGDHHDLDDYNIDGEDYGDYENGGDLNADEETVKMSMMLMITIITTMMMMTKGFMMMLKSYLGLLAQI